MTDCIFCKIIEGEIPSNKIYEDEDTFAFLDIKPVNIGHTLVVPKRHSRNLMNIDDESLSRTINVVKKVAIALKKSLNADGVNMGMNNEPGAGQVVFHTHFHVIPRFKDDGIKLWPQKDISQEELAETAEKIKNKLTEF